MVSERLTVGQRVTWVIECGGRNKIKVGFVCAVVPEMVHWKKCCHPDKLQIVTFDKEMRPELSYIIVVKGLNLCKDRLYWPKPNCLTVLPR